METWLQSVNCSTRTSSACVPPSPTRSIACWLAGLAALALAACGDAAMSDRDASSPGMDAGAPDAPAVDAASDDAGPSGCASDDECDDGIDCTVDTCVTATGGCRHAVTPASCPVGESCNLLAGGCDPGPPCATSVDCEDDDPCTTLEACDPAARVCTYRPLDGDRDGDPPRVCGGGDCDDSDADVFLGAEELCNSSDDDCDGTVDEAAGASALCVDPDRRCTDGRCECLPEFTCASAPGRCVDTRSDPAHCGACDRACAAGDGCRDGTCAPCDVPGGPCCWGPTVLYCDGDLMCDFATQQCIECGPGTVGCSGTCVAFDEDERNCGTCGTRCEVSLDGGVTLTLGLCRGGTCAYCGRSGDPCCEGSRLCEGTLICRSETGTCGPR
ncbi:MAG: putative metal-binding motif-containing protein [Sandaracinaceae bacterium]|nr:putative metal-binding motif-containing protein [Sandaracinaceae bacterium]